MWFFIVEKNLNESNLSFCSENTNESRIQKLVNCTGLSEPMKNSIPTQRSEIFGQMYGIHVYYNLAPKYVSDSICLLQKHAFRIIVEIQKIFHLN